MFKNVRSLSNQPGFEVLISCHRGQNGDKEQSLSFKDLQLENI